MRVGVGFIAVVAAGCLDTKLPDLAPLPPAGAVVGSVVFAEPGQTNLRPAKGTVVELIGSNVTTTATGDTAAFSLTPVSTDTGTVAFRFDADGDGVPDKQRLVRLSGLGVKPGKTVSLGEVVLGSNGTLRGRVLREDVRSSGGHGGTGVLVPEGPYFTYTGDDGTFVLEALPEGLLTVSTFRAGYRAATETIELRSAEVFTLKTLSLVRESGVTVATVRGRVLVPGGGPASQTAVTISNGATTTTDEQGAYELRGVPFGVSTLGFQKQGYRSAKLVNLVIGAATVTIRDVTLEPGDSMPIDLDAGVPVYDAGPPVDAGEDGGGDGGIDGGLDAGLDAGSADAGPDAGPLPQAVLSAPLFVTPGAPFTINAAQSTGGPGLSFLWTQDAGPTLNIMNNGTPLAAAPRLNAPGTATLLKFNLTVVDVAGRSSAPVSAVIPVAVPPIPTITNVPSSVAGGQRVYLSGATSSDPNGAGITSYDWSVSPTTLGIVVTPLPGGVVQLDMPSPVTTAVPITVRLTVTNGLTLSATSAPVMFQLTTGTLPQWFVDAGPAQSTVSGATVTLTGSVFTPQPDAGFTFRWTPDREPDGGIADWILSDPTSPTTTFIAPRVDGPVPRLITLTLTATDVTGTHSPTVRSSQTTVNVVDRRPPQLVATSVTSGRFGLWSAWVEFDEEVSPVGLNGVTVALVGPGPPMGIGTRTVEGRRVWISLRQPLTPGYQYALGVSGIQDVATPANTFLGTTQTFIAASRWSAAWETSWSSSSEVWPALIARRGASVGTLQVFLAGRVNGTTWASQPFDPQTCAAPPCIIPDDTSAPQTALTGPRPRGHKGHLFGNVPIATLQLADPQGTPAVAWRWNNGWQAIAPPPGTMFPTPSAVVSPFADDGGFKVASWDGGAWSTFATLSTDTAEFSTGPTSDPIGFGMSASNAAMMIFGRSSNGATGRIFTLGSSGFVAGGQHFGPFTDARVFSLLAGGGGGGPMWLRAGGSLETYCAIGCGAGPYAVTTSVTSFDVLTDNDYSPTPVAIGGQLQLRTDRGVLQPGPLRAGMPSTSLNNDPMCTADRPEVALVDGRIVIAWQERCGTGPWKVYLRVAD